MAEKRPKLKIEWEPIDWLIESLSLLFVLFLLIYPAYYYESIPGEIPTHYNMDGQADAFGNKTELWLLPIIGLLMYVGLFLLNRIPHQFNYPGTITEENAYTQYQNASRLMRAFNLTFTGAFAYIIYIMVQSALGQVDGLGRFFTPLLLTATIGISIYFLYQATKK